MAPKMSRSVLERAIEKAKGLRAEFRQRGEFELTDYRIALADALAEFRPSAYDGLVAYVAERVDKDATRERHEETPSFPGIQWELEGEYRLGEGRRVAKELARIEHVETVIAQDERNLAAVMRASARKHEELSMLRPYWSRPGVTKRQAVDAYVADHPDQSEGSRGYSAAGD